MEKFVRIYLYILPVYLLASIIFSAFRTVYYANFAENLLLFSAILDLLIVCIGWKELFNKVIAVVFFLLTMSFLIGLLSQEISRRFITDFTNPFFFFAKIYIFKAYWKKVDFSKYINNYYIKVSFWGSLILLPLVYSIFSAAGATRLSIFPPMELPFSSYMQSRGIFFLISLIIILLYGKRAQLIGAMLTFVVYVFIFRTRKILSYLIIGLIGLMVLSFIFERYSENYAVNRLLFTFEKIEDGHGMEMSAGRAEEIEYILRDMKGPFDYLFGKGFGFEYWSNDLNEMRANAHFTPLALLSKYGLFFTVFFYTFLFYRFFRFKRNLSDNLYFTAIGTCLFIFFESFFAYSVFVTPIFPIALGYVLYRQDYPKASRNYE